jgi:hypothetical protein
MKLGYLARYRLGEYNIILLQPIIHISQYNITIYKQRIIRNINKYHYMRHDIRTLYYQVSNEYLTQYPMIYNSINIYRKYIHLKGSVYLVSSLDIKLYDMYYVLHRNIRISSDKYDDDFKKIYEIMALLFDYGRYDKFTKYGYNEIMNTLYEYEKFRNNNNNNNNNMILSYSRLI